MSDLDDKVIALIRKYLEFEKGCLLDESGKEAVLKMLSQLPTGGRGIDLRDLMHEQQSIGGTVAWFYSDSLRTWKRLEAELKSLEGRVMDEHEAQLRMKGGKPTQYILDAKMKADPKVSEVRSRAVEAESLHEWFKKLFQVTQYRESMLREISTNERKDKELEKLT
jgi:hypothetical protein